MRRQDATSSRVVLSRNPPSKTADFVWSGSDGGGDIVHLALAGIRHDNQVSFTTTAMNTRYVVETGKSPAQAVSDLQESVKQYKFGVLHSYNLKETLAGKGFELPHECHILEVCNPQQAFHVLTADIGMNVALPCRLSVYEEAGVTKIGMIRPAALFSLLSQRDDLRLIAEEVEKQMIRIIDDTK